ncbi:MAG: site-specific DNA-methyltransferase, partial [Bacteroidaceae bacterium]|nr:site-specific DNA-methyltransferase [Bacteroidaceae bacterium]
MDTLKINSSIHLFQGDSLNFYDKWESPMVIISDGPYGINGFKGDLKTPLGLDEWYEPHIAAWTKKATPQTTLWFWNTELGWATVHPIFTKYGWEFKTCNVWNKGMSHVAGNTNTKTISHLPVVSEVCIQYVKKPTFRVDGKNLSMKDWLRYE